MAPMQHSRAKLAALLTLVLVSAGMAGVGAVTASSDGRAEPESSAAATNPLAGGRISATEATLAPELVGLVNADGSAFDLAELRGNPSLLFFGYTHCPDVCPATIGELFGVFEAMPAVPAVFISVDPARDTAAFLDEWTQYFPSNFKAVTGSPGAIRRAADNYGVKYARVETSSTTGYTMSHTAYVYLIDAEGRLRTSYPYGTSAEAMVADLVLLDRG